jgi:hypothetical protein
LDRLFGASSNTKKKPKRRSKDGIDHQYLAYQREVHHVPIPHFSPQPPNQELTNVLRVHINSKRGAQEFGYISFFSPPPLA